MAKVNSLITLLGSIDGLTFVKSTKYGDHIRAARGTRKKAKLNKACQEQSKKLVKSNTPAKIIKDAIDPYRDDFRYGQLWQDLVRTTNDAMGKNAEFDFSRLKPFEFHPKHRLDRLFNVESTAKVDSKSSRLRVTLSSDARPLFHHSLDLDGYRVTVIVVFPDFKKQRAKTEALSSSIIPLKEKLTSLEVDFDIPPRAKSFLVCVRVDGCEMGMIEGSMESIGMRMVQAGRV